MSKLTLDEAIKHCLEVAEQKERDSAELIDILDELDVDACKECAADHRQLAEWLKELKERRAADGQPIRRGRWISQGNDMWLCSNCKENKIFSIHENDRTEKQRYCCRCGARMDLKDGDTE